MPHFFFLQKFKFSLHIILGIFGYLYYMLFLKETTWVYYIYYSNNNFIISESEFSSVIILFFFLYYFCILIYFSYKSKFNYNRIQLTNDVIHISHSQKIRLLSAQLSLYFLILIFMYICYLSYVLYLISNFNTTDIEDLILHCQSDYFFHLLSSVDLLLLFL